MVSNGVTAKRKKNMVVSETGAAAAAAAIPLLIDININIVSTKKFESMVMYTVGRS